MTNLFNFNPGPFLSASWQLLSDVSWIMLAQTQNRTYGRHVRQATADLCTSASPQRPPQFKLSEDTQETIRKINNVTTKIALASNYLKRGCWYFASLSVVAFLFTRIFTVIVAIGYLAFSAIFATLGGDFANIETYSNQMRHKFQQMLSDNGIGERAQLIHKNDIRASRTLLNIQYIRHDLTQLKTSLYILNYFLNWTLLDDIDSRLNTLESQVSEFCPRTPSVRPLSFDERL